MHDYKLSSYAQPYALSGLFTLALRLVTGWTYFSAFWRRLILENKLDPDAAGYIGEKFNHFLPNALLLKPMIGYLSENPELLWWFMLVFTLVEAVVGLLFMLGLFTRLMSIGVFSLAMGILLSAGWLGTTCLDEWQIGVLGVAAGFSLFLSGGGRVSLDHYMLQSRFAAKSPRLLSWLTSGPLPLAEKPLRRLAFGGAMGILALTLFTNQYFHGGVWGTLHNLSVKPHVVISDSRLQDDTLSFTVFRDQGADVYGSFLIGIKLLDGQGSPLLQLDGPQLAALQPRQIRNRYVTKVKPGAHSLVIPLGAEARLSFGQAGLAQLPPGRYVVELTDISGLQWTADLLHNH